MVAGGALLSEAKYMRLITLLTLFFGQCVSLSHLSVGCVP